MANTEAIAHAERIAEALNEKFPAVEDWDYRFSVDRRGVKFIRVTHAGKFGDNRSVHLFVDAEGNVYKSATWKAPAKGIRYNIATAQGWDNFIEAADKFGGYLYAR